MGLPGFPVVGFPLRVTGGSLIEIRTPLLPQFSPSSRLIVVITQSVN